MSSINLAARILIVVFGTSARGSAVVALSGVAKARKGGLRRWPERRAAGPADRRSPVAAARPGSRSFRHCDPQGSAAKLLHGPAPGVPGDDFECLVEALDRPRGQQQPFHVSFQTRTPDTRIGARPAGPLRGGRSSNSRQATQMTASPCRVATVAAPIRTDRAQRRQRAAARKQSSVLGCPHDCIPTGIPDALQMLEDVGATVSTERRGCLPADGRSS